MHNHKINQLQSERDHLKEILSRISEDEIINRLSFSKRLQQVEQELETAQVSRREPAKTILHFMGKPVVKNLGISAKFGAEALNYYNTVILALAAKISGSELGDRGILPNAKDNQLLITGTALGSFGFELEENLEQSNIAIDSTPSVIQASMKKAFSIFKASIESDDLLSEEIEDLDDRVLREIRQFLQTIANNEAFCSIELDNEYFSYNSHEQVAKSSQRFDKSNIQEEEIRLNGVFLGVLPLSLAFEFKLKDNDEVIKGKIAASIEDVMAINRSLDTPLNILVLKKTVGKGKPRYTLISYAHNVD